ANPSPERMQSAIDRVEHRLREVGVEEPAINIASLPVIRRPLRFLVAAGAAAAVVVITVVVASGVLQKPGEFPRITMEQIDRGQVFRADDRSGTTLVLPDDSRVEMRTRTELSFDRAPDGVRILLKEGSILVSAAKQRSGHLYVKTKDVTVSVVGTIFL